MGSRFARGERLYIRFKGFDGRWTQLATEYVVGEEAKADELLDRTESKIAAGVKYADPLTGRVTLQRFFEQWIEKRKNRIRTWKDDRGRLTEHVLPALGTMEIEKIRPRHVREVFEALRDSGKIGTKTIRNVYASTKAMFRAALLDDLISRTPCELTSEHLGEVIERDTDEAAESIYPRADVVRLLSAPELPLDRRVLYALNFFGRCRQGEALAICWRHYELDRAPLHRLKVARSHDRDTTKSGRVRYMPVHPTLAAMLAEWRLRWPSIYGRQPTPDDLVVPYIRQHGKQGHQLATGARRTKSSAYKAFVRDLAALGLPHRRGHDLGASFITHAEEDGADRERLAKCTHTGGRKKLGAFEKYLRQNWPVLCGEVLKLRLDLRPHGADVLPLNDRAGNPSDSRETAGEACCTVAASTDVPEESRDVAEWRRRESNPGPKARNLEPLRA